MSKNIGVYKLKINAVLITIKLKIHLKNGRIRKLKISDW